MNSLPGGEGFSANSSDYGSDFTPEEEEILSELLDNLVADTEKTGPRDHSTDVVTGVAGFHSQPLDPATVTVPDIEDYVRLPNSQPGDIRGKETISPIIQAILDAWDSLSDLEIEDVSVDRRVEQTDSTERRDDGEDTSESQKEAPEVDVNGESSRNGALLGDKRSPLERFRKAPRRNLSVTDLVSPSWCELQYWYSLTKHGRKRPTPAMKQGTAVHKTLEEEVHTTVPVEVQTREDGWGLRLINVIQGLQALKTSGKTREIEVWGVIDGEMVTGIIDELSFECPDPELESTSVAGSTEVQPSTSLTPNNQMPLTEYFASTAGGGKTLSDLAVTDSDSTKKLTDTFSSTEARIYITDIKTRGSTKLPSISSIGFRPTLLQLQLYYHMLTRMVISDDITIDFIASRHRLDAEKPFSDAFVAQMAGLDIELLTLGSSLGQDSEFYQDFTDILLEHNSLSKLWYLMKQQFEYVFLPAQQTNAAPTAPSTEIDVGAENRSDQNLSTLLSPLLTAVYVSPTADASESTNYIGSRSFLFDAEALYPYLRDGMRFWRGHRGAKGVNVREAWKCRICEFRDECEWRIGKEKESLRRGKGTF